MLGIHVSSKVLLAVSHVTAFVALKSVLVQSVLFTLILGCECFGTLFTFCPTFVAPQLSVGLEVLLAFLTLKNRGGWLGHNLGSRNLHRWWSSNGRSCSGRGGEGGGFAQHWKRTCFAASKLMFASYVCVKLGPGQDDPTF